MISSMIVLVLVNRINTLINKQLTTNLACPSLKRNPHPKLSKTKTPLTLGGYSYLKSYTIDPNIRTNEQDPMIYCVAITNFNLFIAAYMWQLDFTHSLPPQIFVILSMDWQHTFAAVSHIIQ